ncbi:MAG: outer membrane [Beijerinckiaceae bacterium]|nr:MAG: outer membrane [Beijerinckiaceae bacterium]
MTLMTRYRFATAAAVFFILPAAAFAADPLQARRAPAPVYAPAAAKDWTGAYIGAYTGLGTRAFKSSAATPNIPALRLGGAKNERSDSGAALGARAGYNLQSGNIVYGVEGEFGGIVGKTRKTGTNLKAEDNGQAALKGRVGYSFGSTMVFGTAGLAVGGATYTSPANGANARKEKSVWRVGSIVGIGAEHMLTEKISLRGDLDFAYFGRSKLSFPAGTTRAESAALNAKLGVNYRF